MDLISVRAVRVPRSRGELTFAPGAVPLAGGTWLYSERQDDVTELVDLTGLGWEPWTADPDGGLTVSATCTLAELVRIPARPEWPALSLIPLCVNSLLASFKIWNTATIGGNIALALPAGGLTSLATALDAVAELWTVDSERRIPVADLVLGVRRTAIEHGEVLRALHFPAAALAGRAAFRRIALSPLGRAGTVVIGRRDADDAVTLSLTGGTERPEVLRFAGIPTVAQLAAAIDGIDTWYDDAHGSPDWREAMSRRFAEEIRRELS
ncbi:FAD binding domain-containing protein [Naasia aerilata]|uniref:FAD-binding molybdopterin dehydrogenase n=1 Tax=Naasia aerilata TaxID=1162966 RepID=A0ABN6XL39_9MICO|nr:FAD binding domain-containing protein [Naasia aerilata]BDZ45682.1 FAD-binding molybdopterin dehydrogenase [Naasia aerilata]